MAFSDHQHDAIVCDGDEDGGEVGEGGGLGAEDASAVERAVARSAHLLGSLAAVMPPGGARGESCRPRVLCL